MERNYVTVLLCTCIHPGVLVLVVVCGQYGMLTVTASNSTTVPPVLDYAATTHIRVLFLSDVVGLEAPGCRIPQKTAPPKSDE